MADDQNSDPGPPADGRMIPRHRRIVRWSAVAFLATFILWLFAAADYKVSNAWSTISSAHSGEFVTSSVMSVIIGVLAAVFFSYIENKHAQAALQAIYRSAPRDLVGDTLNLLEMGATDGLVYEEVVDFLLMPAQQDGFIIMRVKYKYKKILHNRDLFFRIIRLKKSADQEIFVKNHAAIDALYQDSELFHQVDEVELRETFGDDDIDDAFVFEFMKINGSEVSLSAVATDPNTLHYRLPDTLDLKKPTAFEYAFKYAVLKTDIAFGVAERLTKGLTIRFMRDGALAGKIGHEAYEIMSAAQGSPVITEDPPGTHCVSHEGWIIPKSGAVFHWWPI